MPLWSCPFLEEILNRHLDELSWEEADDTGAPEDEAIIPIQSQIQNLLKAARTLEASDPKLEALRNIIRDKQSLPNNKAMLFSSFRHTLSYLFNHLSKDGFRVGLVHGERRMRIVCPFAPALRSRRRMRTVSTCCCFPKSAAKVSIISSATAS